MTSTINIGWSSGDKYTHSRISSLPYNECSISLVQNNKLKVNDSYECCIVNNDQSITGNYTLGMNIKVYKNDDEQTETGAHNTPD